MQPDRLARVERDDRRTGVAAERRAVVLHDTGLDLHELARGQSLLVVVVAENLAHQVRLWDAAVRGWIADDRDLIAIFRSAGRELDRTRERARAVRPNADERHIRPLVVLDVQHLLETELEARGIVELLEKVDPGLHRGAHGLQKDELLALAPRELARDVAIRDDDVLRNEPSRTNPREVGMVPHLDAAHRADGGDQDRLRSGEARLPSLGVRGIQDKVGGALLDREHGAQLAPDDGLGDELATVRRRGRGSLQRAGRGTWLSPYVGHRSRRSLPQLPARFVDLVRELGIALGNPAVLFLDAI